MMAWIVRGLIWLCMASISWAFLDNLRPLLGILQSFGGGPELRQELTLEETIVTSVSQESSIQITFAEDMTEVLQGGLNVTLRVINLEKLEGQRIETAPLEQSAMFLFAFRRTEPAARLAASCHGRLLLEASLYYLRKYNITPRDAQGTLTNLNSMLSPEVCNRLLPEGCKVTEAPIHCLPSDPYRTIDGSCNNLQNPKWGFAMIPFVRYLAPAYEDGVNTMRGEGRTEERRLPSPRLVSHMVHGGEERPPLTHMTLMVMQWGQFVDHEVVHTPEAAGVDEDGDTVPLVCCRDGVASEDVDSTDDCRPIDVTADPLFSTYGRTCMRFVRSLIANKGCILGPREQVNQVTAYIDGSTVYGSTPEVAQMLRTMQGGHLKKTSAPGLKNRHFLPVINCKHSGDFCFKAGDERVNEQPALTSMHMLWLRVHENLVTQFATLNPHWDDERLYQEARQVVAALMQHITYGEFLPLVLGDDKMREHDLYPRPGDLTDTYDPNVDASIANVFATAAFRFGHTLVNDVLKGSGKEMPLSEGFMKPQVLQEIGTSPTDLLLGLTSSHSQAADSYLVPTLTNKLFAEAGEPIGLDLMSLNIQRGRDHGLPSYTMWRKACGLPPVASFTELASVMKPQMAFGFSTVYKNVDDMDLFPAGLAEYAVPGGLLGHTLSNIIAEQFSSLKKGDRFWYENLRQPKPFTQAQLANIHEMSMAAVMCNHLDLLKLQPHAFFTLDTPGNQPLPCSTYKWLNIKLWQEPSNLPILSCAGTGTWQYTPDNNWCNVVCMQHNGSVCPPPLCNCSITFHPYDDSDS